jgi:hypothetical protein
MRRWAFSLSLRRRETIRISLAYADRRQSDPGCPEYCLLSKAGTREWGGAWWISHHVIRRTADDGQVTTWRPCLSARIALALSDKGLPPLFRSVKLARVRESVLEYPPRKPFQYDGPGDR